MWPNNKKFAFSIIDDTDLSTVKNVKAVYDLLYDLGFLTTKTVWPTGLQTKYGETCEHEEYLQWILSLQKRGFEISFHNASYDSSYRDKIILGLDKFKDLFGHYPYTYAQHLFCRENIYWGDSRLTGMHKHLYNLLTRYKNFNRFQGHVSFSKYFWGDECFRKIKYVRNFCTNKINTLKEYPLMPYHDPLMPFVKYWFASSLGSNVNLFNDCLSEKNIDLLEEEGGACIIYTHFSFGFYKDKYLNDRFKYLMKRISKKNGWFVPVNVLLDYLLQKKGEIIINKKQKKTMEQKWLLEKIKVGYS